MPKQGLSILPLQTSPVPFQANRSILFQGQTATVIKQNHNLLYLDTPVKLTGDHYVVEQKCISTDVEITREHLQETWSSMWNGMPTPIPEGYWDEAAEFVTSIQDCPTCNFQPFTQQSWADCLRGAKPSARGSCGFTHFETILIQGHCLQLLFKLHNAIEHDGLDWPDGWVIGTVFGSLQRIRTTVTTRYPANFGSGPAPTLPT